MYRGREGRKPQVTIPVGFAAYSRNGLSGQQLRTIYLQVEPGRLPGVASRGRRRVARTATADSAASLDPVTCQPGASLSAEEDQ